MPKINRYWACIFLPFFVLGMNILSSLSLPIYMLPIIGITGVLFFAAIWLQPNRYPFLFNYRIITFDNSNPNEECTLPMEKQIQRNQMRTINYCYKCPTCSHSMKVDFPNPNLCVVCNVVICNHCGIGECFCRECGKFLIVHEKKELFQILKLKPSFGVSIFFGILAFLGFIFTLIFYFANEMTIFYIVLSISILFAVICKSAIKDLILFDTKKNNFVSKMRPEIMDRRMKSCNPSYIPTIRPSMTQSVLNVDSTTKYVPTPVKIEDYSGTQYNSNTFCPDPIRANLFAPTQSESKMNNILQATTITTNTIICNDTELIPQSILLELIKASAKLKQTNNPDLIFIMTIMVEEECKKLRCNLTSNQYENIAKWVISQPDPISKN